MTLLPPDRNGCPYLILAPMEGVGDSCFRRAIATIGGFDEAVRDFLRVPSNAHIASLATQYQADEIEPVPLAAQLMGSDIDLMAQMAQAMERRGAPRIDLNCGCPSHTVTGRGAGSSLLREPTLLYDIAKAMVKAVSVPVTAKLRSGFDDTSLFRENLLAAQESGISFLTLHPRTKAEGYAPPARWELIAEAKALLTIPVVGNGDINSADDAIKMLQNTGCDALMIGRGSLANPFLFHQIKARFSGLFYVPAPTALRRYLDTYLETLSSAPPRTQINKMKQLLGYLFKGDSRWLALRQTMLQASHSTAAAFLEYAWTLMCSVTPTDDALRG